MRYIKLLLIKLFKINTHDIIVAENINNKFIIFINYYLDTQKINHVFRFKNNEEIKEFISKFRDFYYHEKTKK